MNVFLRHGDSQQFFEAVNLEKKSKDSVKLWRRLKF